MDKQIDRLQVKPSNAKPYDVILQYDWDSKELFDRLNVYSKIFIITQKNIRNLYLLEFLKSIKLQVPENQILEIEDGEIAKHISGLPKVYNQLIEAGIDRNSCILALGGGVVGDFSGFVASTILRGVAFLQFPTTLLASVDSSVGGKVAVNVDYGKNMVGAFYQPKLVYCNLLVFNTLKQKDWKCGLAEMCKHAILDSSGKLFAYLKDNLSELRNPQSEVLKKAIYDSASFKAKIVNQDEREQGKRAILNLGHTTAHALESITSYKKFSHGEAVSRGLITALLLSREMYGVSDEKIDDYIELLIKLDLPCDTAGILAEQVLQHMQFDKKSVSGIPRFVLIKKNLEPEYGIQISTNDFEKVWHKQKDRFG